MIQELTIENFNGSEIDATITVREDKSVSIRIRDRANNVIYLELKEITYLREKAIWLKNAAEKD